jgi:hypothetical protein
MALSDRKKKSQQLDDSDTWLRFERAVDVLAKSRPQHRTSQEEKAKKAAD